MLTLTDVFEKFKASVQEITASEMEIAREIESEVAPEEVLNHYNYEETLTDERLLFTDEQWKLFLEME